MGENGKQSKRDRRFLDLVIIYYEAAILSFVASDVCGETRIRIDESSLSRSRSPRIQNGGSFTDSSQGGGRNKNSSGKL